MLEEPRSAVGTAGTSTGPKDAPVTIVEFEDFSSPSCRSAQDSIKQLRQRYGDKLRWVYRDLPMHFRALKPAEAARCADEQGKFTEYQDALFADQSKLEADDLKAIAVELKLDFEKFSACLAGEKYLDAIRGDMTEGRQMGITSTPAFFANGRFINGTPPVTAFEELINDELAKRASHTSEGMKRNGED